MDESIAVINFGENLLSNADLLIDNPSAIARLAIAGRCFGIAAAFLGVLNAFSSPKQQDQIRREFEKVLDGIDHVRSDIQDLEKSLNLAIAKSQYSADSNVIITGMKYLSYIPNYPDYKERLKELCGNRKCALAVNNLVLGSGGISGNSPFHLDILTKKYEKTGGHIREMAKLSQSLLKLVVGGIGVVLSYETMERGPESARQMEQNQYTNDTARVQQHIASMLEKCKENLHVNAENNLEWRIRQNAGEIEEFLSQKYSWLHFVVVAYDDMWGNKYHHVTCHDQCVKKLHYPRVKPRCVIAFYMNKYAPYRFASSSLLTEGRDLAYAFSGTSCSSGSWWNPRVDWAKTRLDCMHNYLYENDIDYNSIGVWKQPSHFTVASTNQTRVSVYVNGVQTMTHSCGMYSSATCSTTTGFIIIVLLQ